MSAPLNPAQVFSTGCSVGIALLLVQLCYTDLKHRTLHNKTLIILTAVVCLQIGLHLWMGVIQPSTLAYKIAISLGSGLLFLQCFNAGMMGGGDVKFYCILGLAMPMDHITAVIAIHGVTGLCLVSFYGWKKYQASDVVKSRPPVALPWGVTIASSMMAATWYNTLSGLA